MRGLGEWVRKRSQSKLTDRGPQIKSSEETRRKIAKQSRRVDEIESKFHNVKIDKNNTSFN
jgi:hypothetical protein